MPLYDYSCSTCEHDFDEFATVADRLTAPCPQCKGQAELVIKKANSIIVDDMPLTWHPADGQYYSSKSKFRQITHDHGMVEVGDQVPSTEESEKRKRLDKAKKEKAADTKLDNILNGIL